MYYYMYRITNWFNGKVYVGVHTTNRLDDGYMGSGVVLHKAFKRYSKELFTKDILQFFDTPEAMFAAEAEVVDQDFIEAEWSYNIALGGKGSFAHMTTEQKSRGGKNGGKNGGKIGGKISFLGKKHTKETLEKLKSIATGKRHSIETKLKMSESAKGRKRTPETLAKMSIARKGKYTGVESSQYGTCWVYSPDEMISKKIPKGELSVYLNNSWLKGRKIKFSS